jgi:flagellar biogenesis protein FliO
MLPLCAVTTFAAGSTVEETVPEFTVMSSVAKLILSCVVVIALIWVTVYILRMVSQRRSAGAVRGNFIQVIARQYLTPQKALYLVRVGAKIFVMAESSGGFQKITDLEESDLVRIEKRSEQSAGFPQILKRFQRKDSRVG